MKLYLDTIVILKRYLTETGTDVTDMIFDKAETGDLIMTISLWNIGEALGVLDEKRRKSWLTEKEFTRTLNNFAEELIKLIRLKTLEITPVSTAILTDTWNLLMTYHVYEADALQITTCMRTKNDVLISSDEKLVETSRKAGLQAFHVIRDEQKLSRLV